MKLWTRETPLFVFAVVQGPFGAGAWRRDFATFLLSMQQRDEALRRLMERAGEGAFRAAAQSLEAGAHAVVVVDDLAHDRGTYVSPSVLQEMYFPCLEKLVGALKAEGAAVVFHSDGDLRAVLKGLVSCGIDGLHSLEKRAGMDIRAVKEIAGNRLCLFGGMDVQGCAGLPEEEVRRRVRELVECARDCPGYIFGSTSGYAGGAPANLLRAIYSTARESGRP